MKPNGDDLALSTRLVYIVELYLIHNNVPSSLSLTPFCILHLSKSFVLSPEASNNLRLSPSYIYQTLESFTNYTLKHKHQNAILHHAVHPPRPLLRALLPLGRVCTNRFWIWWCRCLDQRNIVRFPHYPKIRFQMLTSK